MSKENEEPDFLDLLSPEDRQRYLLMAGAALILLVSWFGVRGIALITLLAMYFSTRKPGYTSFRVFFQQ